MQVVKVLGNNVVIAHSEECREVILVGKGIGFKKAVGERIAQNAIEKTFILFDEKEQIKYQQLITQISDKVIDCMNEIFIFLKEKLGELPQELLVNLTDHVAFSTKRIQTGMLIHNPFLLETKMLYPDDFHIAQDVCEIIRKHLKIDFPEDEVGFIALYVHSASHRKKMKDIKTDTHIIAIIIELLETELQTNLNKEDLYYKRFIYHLKFTLACVKSSDYQEIDLSIATMIKKSYPECYQLAQKIARVIEEQLQVAISESEIIYLSMHMEQIMHINQM